MFLNDTWRLYFHDPVEDVWTRESYASLGVVSSVENFWTLWNSIDEHIHKGMFFLMREHVFPVWDDASLVNGGTISCKIPFEEANDFFCKLSLRALGETLLDKSARRVPWDAINGISIAPKRFFNIAKIWVGPAGPDVVAALRLPTIKPPPPRPGAAPIRGRQAPKPPQTTFSSFTVQIQRSHTAESLVHQDAVEVL